MISFNLSSRPLCLLLALGAGLIAPLAYPPLEQIRDSLFWAQITRDGTDLYSIYNPHHLIYLPVIRFVYLALSQVCATCDPIVAAQVHSVAWGLIAVAALFAGVLRLMGSPWPALAAALTLTISRTFWTFEMQVSPYVPMVGALTLLGLAAILLETGAASRPRFLLLVCAYVLAVLYHQAAVILILPIWIFLWLRYPAGARMRTMALAAVLSGVPVLVLYLMAFAHLYGAREIGFAALLKFATRYSSIPDPTFGTLANFSPAGIYSLLNFQLLNFFVPPWGLRNMAVLAFGAMLAWLAVWHVALALRGRSPAIRIFLLAWLATMLLFYLWANPTEDAYLMVNVPPLLLLGMLSVRDMAPIPAPTTFKVFATVAATIALLGLTWWNLQESILPMHASRGHDFERARRIADATPRTCLILEGNQLISQNLGYYFDRGTSDGWDLVSWFYFGKDDFIPFTWERFRFSDHACIAIQGAHLSPTMNVRTTDGWKAPKLWFEYFGWLMAVRPGNSGQIQAHCFDVTQGADGTVMVILDTANFCTHQTLFTIFQALDSALGTINAKHGPNGFADWYLRHESVLPALGQVGKRSRFPG